MLPPSLFFFLTHCPVLSNGPDERLFVMEEDVGLRSADVGVYLW
jgi:hypothetical protein